MSSRRGAVAIALGVASLFAIDDVHAQMPSPSTTTTSPAVTTQTTTQPSAASIPLTWRYTTFRPVEYVATGIIGAAAIGAYFLLEPQSTPKWRGGILFDDAMRGAFRLRSSSARDTARIASDVNAIATLVLAIGVDSIAVPLARGSLETAEQLALIDAETISLSSILTTVAYDRVGRARPSYDDCQRDPSFDPLCRTAPTTSFWSGHAAEVFSAAGLSCAHHAYAHIYGSALGDALGCAGVITLASTTSTLRLLGDRHYASDILTGALIGFGIGYGLPTLLHYGSWNETATAAKTLSAGLTPMSGGAGLLLRGGF